MYTVYSTVFKNILVFKTTHWLQKIRLKAIRSRSLSWLPVPLNPLIIRFIWLKIHSINKYIVFYHIGTCLIIIN